MISSNISFTFGDIIEFYESKYVFLVATLRFVFIARILTEYNTKEAESLLKIHQNKGSSVEENPLFWFVRLTTEDFQGQWAHLAHAQQSSDSSKFFKKISSKKLVEADLIALKKEILEKRTWPELKREIKDIPTTNVR
ncbi:MAG: hypothetical protein UR54_C0004G0017 [Candidatus Roizmanbacteria bacterium GW2011_GWA2_34_18]|uniref:Uncharacterized protein n=1 Tax=Candidatus Roizmanbacteria bacterium GW2011_GWA2_34_18 TaxID=1618477 RepID=A0A0G0AVM5_9BACT|nr:MAG: hypothetical protein UR54_C0004G0017 [Candidatus Roizmanbacteria bacterium GW2011_GWA2_34_18]